MLKKEVIKANAVLSGLSDEQIAAIETLSQNDETTVIGQKIGEVHRQYDTTILNATGVPRNGDEKSYDYLARAAKDLKDKADSVQTLNSTIQTLTSDKTRLEKAIADGSTDAETAKQLKQVKAELEQTKGQFTELQTKLTTAETEHSKKVFEMQVGFEINQATAGVAFKKELPATVTGVIMQNAVSKLQASYKPDYIDDGQGGKRLVFRNEAGAVMNNPENQLNPYTAAELLNKELKTMGVLDEGRKQPGAGTNPPAGGGAGGGTGTIDIAGARTRVEANDIITKGLLSQGLTKGSAEFEAASTQAWKDGNVSALPEQ